MAELENIKPSGTKGLNQLKLPFPWKLYKLLEDSDKEGSELAQIVSWFPDGKAFKVHKPAEFGDRVMKTYFNQNKFQSFTRQLYLYGFLKTQTGPKEGAFSHPQFLRENKESSLSIRRNQFKVDRRLAGKRSPKMGSSKLSPPLSAVQRKEHVRRAGEILSDAISLVPVDYDNTPLPLLPPSLNEKHPFDLEPRPIEEMLFKSQH